MGQICFWSLHMKHTLNIITSFTGFGGLVMKLQVLKADVDETVKLCDHWLMTYNGHVVGHCVVTPITNTKTYRGQCFLQLFRTTSLRPLVAIIKNAACLSVAKKPD